MKCWFRLLKAENKRAWKIFPKMLLQAIALVLVTGAIAFCAVKLLDQEKEITVRAAVVMEEENPLTELAYEYVKEAEKGIEFVRCDMENAKQGLAEGKFAAVIVLDGHLVEGIMNGQNPSVLVILSEELAGVSAFFQELTQAGAMMLSTAQAEIYAVYELAGELEITEGLAELQNRINMSNLEMAMGRAGLFHDKEVTPTGSLSLETYYFASAVTALLLFLGLPMGMFLKQDSKAAVRQYKRAGIGAGRQQAARWLTVFGIYGAVTAVIALLSFLLRKSRIQFMGVWLIAGSMAAFVLLLYEAVERKSSAVLLLTFLAAMLLFLSGGIIPMVFFPAGLRNAAAFLPSTYWITGIGNAALGVFGGKETAVCVLYGAGFFCMSVYFRWRRL